MKVLRKIVVLMIILTVFVMMITSAFTLAPAIAQKEVIQTPSQAVMTVPAAETAPFTGNEAVNGIPLILVVVGLVELFKKLGVKDNWLILTSIAVGLVLGIGYLYSLGPLVGFTAWFDAVIYSVFLGLTASGLWAAAKSALGSQSTSG